MPASMGFGGQWALPVGLRQQPVADPVVPIVVLRLRGEVHEGLVIGTASVVHNWTRESGAVISDVSAGHPALLLLTGERTAPGLSHENYWFRRHEAAYAALGPLCAGSRVLDAGCGEGYGAAAARQAGATTVVALDYDRWAVEHAARTYRLPAVRGNLVDLPVADDALDLVLSLQTLEHVWNQPRFLAECARVLRPGGRLALTTPNRLTFPPGNPFHAREVDVRELRALAESSRFHVETLLGLRHGDRITAYEREHGDVVSAQLGSDPDRWPEGLGAFVASVTAQDFVFSSEDLDTGLDLLLVAART
jgi:SAM-dependent methyltransferase